MIRRQKLYRLISASIIRLILTYDWLVGGKPLSANARVSEVY